MYAFALLSFSALGIAYLNFEQLNLNAWKTFNLPRTFLFWFFPAVLIWLLAPKRSNKELIYVLLYLVFSFVIIDFIPDYSSWVSDYFVDKRFASLFYWAAMLVVLYLSLAVFGRKVFETYVFKQKFENSSQFYLPSKAILGETVWFLVAAPFVYLLLYSFSGSLEFKHTYSFYKEADAINYSLSKAISWEIIYGLSFFSLEFFFRGFIIHSLKPIIGWLAIPSMALFYCMLHFGKPMPECIGSLLGGLLLGGLSYKSGSIWAGLLCHLSLAIGMDLFVLLAK